MLSALLCVNSSASKRSALRSHLVVLPVHDFLLVALHDQTGVQRRRAGKRGCRLARRAWRGASRDIPVPALPPDRRRAGPRPAPAALRHRGGLVGLRGALACSQRCGCACTVGVARTCRKAPAAPAAGAAPELSGECGARQRRAVDVGRGTRRVAGLAGCAGRLARCAQLLCSLLPSRCT